jgi:hypothetical protein
MGFLIFLGARYSALPLLHPQRRRRAGSRQTSLTLCKSRKRSPLPFFFPIFDCSTTYGS